MSYTDEDKAVFALLQEQYMQRRLKTRLDTVSRKSPYSRAINPYIKDTRELEVYISLHLVEAVVTRPALILDIDPYYTDAAGVSNLEKMLHGNSPRDAVSGDVIFLHHIGQQYESPFAELPYWIHGTAGRYSVLHTSTQESWRRDPVKQKATVEEMKRYWSMRGICIHETLKRNGCQFLPKIDS